MAITGGHTPLFRHSNIFIGIFHVSHMVGLDICVYKHVDRYIKYMHMMLMRYMCYLLFTLHTPIYIQLFFGADEMFNVNQEEARLYPI